MADLWYYTENGQQRGPVPFGQLQRMAADGQLRPGDMVIEAGKQQWQPASQVAGLSPQGRPAGPPGPRYDEPPRSSGGMPAWAWVLILLGVGLPVLCVVGSLVGITMIGRNANATFGTVSSSLSGPGATGSNGPFEMTVVTSANKLLQDYAENANFADIQYKGKTLKVDGRVSAVERDEFGTVIVKLGTGGEQRVWCYINEDEGTRASRRKPGQTVTLKGTCEGMNPATGIEIRRCGFAD